MKLPRYKISMNPELAKDGETLGIQQIAYTSTPAIITKGMYFSSLERKFTFSDDLKMRVVAPALIPGFPIYREDDEIGAYEVEFDVETIEQLRQDFMLNKGKLAFNLDHTDTTAPSYILDSWITGPPETDLSYTKYGIQVPEGSWMIISQFTDKEYFQREIIGKDRIGYSIEGFLGLALNKIKENKKEIKMTKQKFESAILADGTKLFISKMEIGGEVYVIDENGDKAPVFDAEHILADGSTLVTVDGKITEIKPAIAMEAEETELAIEETELAIEAAVEPVVEVKAAIDEAAVLALVQPKFDELYKIIAELKTLVESDTSEDISEDASQEDMAKKTKMNSQKALASYFTALK